MHRATRRVTTTVAVAAAIAVVAAPAAAGAATTTPRGRFGPGASGSVAAITGSSMEVQSQETGQATVTWTSSTTFTQNATTAASSVAVGDCVTVTGTTAKSTTITAKSVAIVPAPSSGTCTNGAGFAALGALIGAVGSVLLPHAIGDPITLSAPATAGALVVAIAIGLVFGVYPASRAAQLAPIDALRSE